MRFRSSASATLVPSDPASSARPVFGSVLKPRRIPSVPPSARKWSIDFGSTRLYNAEGSMAGSKGAIWSAGGSTIATTWSGFLARRGKMPNSFRRLPSAAVSSVSSMPGFEASRRLPELSGSSESGWPDSSRPFSRSRGVAPDAAAAAGGEEESEVPNFESLVVAPSLPCLLWMSST